MYSLYEESDSLNRPIECYVYDSEKQNFPIKPHWHYLMELFIVTEGECVVKVEDEETVVKAKELFLIHPKSVHSIYTKNNQRVCFKAIKFDINSLNITASYAPKLRSVFKSAERRDMPLKFDEHFTAQCAVEPIFNNCIREITHGWYAYDMMLKVHLYDLLISILRNWQNKGFSVDSETYSYDDRYDIYTITEYIDAHLGDAIKVNDVADKCGISYSNFAKKFLGVYGKTCKDYIETMRIYKVEEFLRFTDFDLNYISQETGFSDCSHMIKCFKKTHDMTPKQYRNQYAFKANT